MALSPISARKKGSMKKDGRARLMLHPAALSIDSEPATGQSAPTRKSNLQVPVSTREWMSGTYALAPSVNAGAVGRQDKVARIQGNSLRRGRPTTSNVKKSFQPTLLAGNFSSGKTRRPAGSGRSPTPAGHHFWFDFCFEQIARFRILIKNPLYSVSCKILHTRRQPGVHVPVRAHNNTEQFSRG